MSQDETDARMAELADAPDSKSGSRKSGSSTLPLGTNTDAALRRFTSGLSRTNGLDCPVSVPW